MVVSSQKPNIHGRWVRYLLYQKNWRQARLAAEMGVDQSMVSRWKRGERVPLEDQWLKLATIAGVDAPTYWQGPPV